MKLKTFSCFMFCLIISAPAFAEITRCINPFSNREMYTKNTDSLTTPRRYMWSQIVQHGSWTTNIQGISICSTSSTTVEVPINATPAKYCWCRKITPRVGNWTYSTTSFDDTASCFSGCAEACRESM